MSASVQDARRLGPKAIGRTSPKKAIMAGLTVQGTATVPLVFLTNNPVWIWVLLVVTFVDGVANLVAIVGFMVSATSGVPNEEQGPASGLATMSQQVGITMGLPIMSAIAATKINALPGGGASGRTFCPESPWRCWSTPSCVSTRRG